MKMVESEAVPVLELNALMAPSGVGYADQVRALAGRPVVCRGVLTEGPAGSLLLTERGLVYGCSHDGPIPTITLCEPSRLLKVTPRPTRVRVLGTLEYGFTVDEHGTATYLRLRGAQPY